GVPGGRLGIGDPFMAPLGAAVLRDARLPLVCQGGGFLKRALCTGFIRPRRPGIVRGASSEPADCVAGREAVDGLAGRESVLRIPPLLEGARHRPGDWILEAAIAEIGNDGGVDR